MWNMVFESPAYRDLSVIARCLLQEFMHIHRPDRNGALSISVRNAAKLLRCNERPVIRAFDELQSHGFIALTEGHHWINGLAREWKLTFEPCGGCEPTDEWQKWNPEKPFRVVAKKNPRMYQIQRSVVPDTTVKAEKGKSVVPDTTVQRVSH